MLCSNYDHVIQIGYGKSGTSTVRNYFEKLGYNSSCPTLQDLKISLKEDKWPLFESKKNVNTCMYLNSHTYIIQVIIIIFS